MKKKILLIATGGTIASIKSKDGLIPNLSPETILTYIPKVREFCQMSTLELFNIDSTNITPTHWKKLVAAIKKEYEYYDGFVIAHGTDTLAYSGAALSYMIQHSPKPIVLTGSQKPIDLENTDAKTNLMDSILYACDKDSHGVTIVFDKKVIAATRAKKVRSKSYNAFNSIDFPFLALIQEQEVLRYLPAQQEDQPIMFQETLGENIFLLKLIPGMNPQFLAYIFNHYDAIIIESFGVGGIPASISEEFYRIRSLHPNTPVIISTQVTHEGSDMTVYEVGQKIKRDCNFLESYDMTPEAVIAKTMWILGQQPETNDQLQQLFYQQVNYDLMYGKNRKPAKK